MNPMSILVYIVFFATLIWLVNKIFDVLITSIIKSTLTQVDDKLAPIVRRLIVAVLLITGLYFLTTFIRFAPPIHLIIGRVFTASIVLLIAVGVSEIINVLFHAALFRKFEHSKENLITTLSFINNISRIIIFVSAILFVLQIFQIDVTPALASAGVIGIAFAFAARDFVANLFSGLSVFFDKPYIVGDYVIIADKHRGEVVEIGMRSTKIRTRDGVQLSVPNAVMTTDAVINETGFDPRLRIRIPIQVDYKDDLQKVENILVDLAYQHREIVNEPNPIVRYREFSDSAVKLELLIIIERPSEKGRIVHEMLKCIHQKFREENISMPYPQRVVHMQKEN